MIAPDIPLVTCMLIQIKYCANLMHSPIISMHPHHNGCDHKCSKSHPEQLPHSREILPIYTKLESHNKRPVGVEHNSKVHNRPTVSTTSNNPFSGVEIFSGRDQESHHRGRKDDSQRRDIIDTQRTSKQGVPIPTIFGFREGWGL